MKIVHKEIRIGSLENLKKMNISRTIIPKCGYKHELDFKVK